MIAALILAAGGSARLGRPKQLVPVGGRPLLRHVTDCAVEAGCRPVFVVLGAEADRIASTLQNVDVCVLRNPDWQQGLSTSIRIGMNAVRTQTPPVGGVILVVADQVRLRPGVLTGLVDAFRKDPTRMVASAYAGTIGTPALFPPSRFEDLVALDGDRGAKELLRRDPAGTLQVSWPDGAFDVDRPEDLAP